MYVPLFANIITLAFSAQYCISAIIKKYNSLAPIVLIKVLYYNSYLCHSQLVLFSTIPYSCTVSGEKNCKYMCNHYKIF